MNGELTRALIGPRLTYTSQLQWSNVINRRDESVVLPIIIDPIDLIDNIGGPRCDSHSRASLVKETY